MAGNGTVSGGAKANNINALIHRVYLKRLLSPDEIKVFNKMFKAMITAYSLEYRPADQMLLSTAVIDYVRAMRGYIFESQNPKEDISDALERATRSMRNNLAEAGITGKSKVLDDNSTNFTSVLAAIGLRASPVVP